jgi:DnaJ-domain-containing protein 1
MKIWIVEHFQEIQLVLLVLFIWVGILNYRKQQPPSQFKVREADRPPVKKTVKVAPPKPSRLELPGIRLSGEPHEILGVAPNATPDEISEAFKNLMKRYHPDRMAGLPTDQRQFYERATQTIIQAKEDLLRKKI